MNATSSVTEVRSIKCGAIFYALVKMGHKAECVMERMRHIVCIVDRLCLRGMSTSVFWAMHDDTQEEGFVSELQHRASGITLLPIPSMETIAHFIGLRPITSGSVSQGKPTPKMNGHTHVAAVRRNDRKKQRFVNLPLAIR